MQQAPSNSYHTISMCHIFRDKSREMKEIDLLHLTPETDVEVLVNQVSSQAIVLPLSNTMRDGGLSSDVCHASSAHMRPADCL